MFYLLSVLKKSQFKTDFDIEREINRKLRKMPCKVLLLGIFVVAVVAAIPTMERQDSENSLNSTVSKTSEDVDDARKGGGSGGGGSGGGGGGSSGGGSSGRPPGGNGNIIYPPRHGDAPRVVLNFSFGTFMILFAILMKKFAILL